MQQLELMHALKRESDSRIVLLVMDGLGGLAMEPGGKTALEAAATPNLDRLAAEGATGQTVPIRPGITPGSGPAHLALFGYEPLTFEVGRGVLEATGVGMQIAKGDLAARGNFCTLDEQGAITDRRAGRLPNEEAVPLVEMLASIEVPGCEFEVRHVREYRFAVVARGEGLEHHIADTDPQQPGLAPLPPVAEDRGSQRGAELFGQWIDRAHHILAGQPKANGLTLRGFSTNPELPSFDSTYGLNAACVAVYPMYRGVSKLVGMKVVEFEGGSPSDEFSAVSRAWNDHDFVFVHIKATDSRGEDGDLEGKAEVIEAVDAALPQLLDLKPAVLAVTGDHSTPARLRSHSWHPVPFLLWAPATIRADASQSFGEASCAHGGLGTFPATDVMPLLMAHAERLDKFGA